MVLLGIDSLCFGNKGVLMSMSLGMLLDCGGADGIFIAADVLGKVATPGDPTIVAVLLRALAHGDDYIRSFAAESLGTIAARGDQTVVAALLRALAHGDDHVRSGAAKSLGMIATRGDQTVVAALRRALGDTDGKVRASAARSLYLLTAPRSDDQSLCGSNARS